jgi:hypothetical protein
MHDNHRLFPRSPVFVFSALPLFDHRVRRPRILRILRAPSSVMRNLFLHLPHSVSRRRRRVSEIKHASGEEGFTQFHNQTRHNGRHDFSIF